MYNEIYQPITEKLEDQKEILTRQLPDIKEQLALLPTNLVDKIHQYEEPIPNVLPDPIGDAVSFQEDINKLFEGYEKEQQQSKQFRNNLNKKINLDLLDTNEYNTSQEVFDFYHALSDDPDEKMTRKEIGNIIGNVSKDIKIY